ncbi:lethal giant larvae like, C-terminal-domain-containing protein [Colletotrichum godetiae]|uniref:Lethal giant larvae like, C-terminal-domain-containing protein n=1 Tax=Colletotrichum godetiae TaxID=1209918 RepID=A0AAJ0EQN1_9PEZI|nr:lethal giant larvae like, C-terminal-domain-containing protein [Colletotrichum godetiae]KAK1659717.1 lethal giant larvae like, C-terminal-domain-containing protein [Colletotrichum godetiae]
MAAFLRQKQTGMQNDLSASIIPELFAPDYQSAYGINSQVSCLAYDPIQSLLAIATNESKFGPGKIFVFGQNRVSKVLEPPRHTSFRSLHFTANKLVSLDVKNELGVWDLDTAKRIAALVCPGQVVSIITDPMLDWAFLGMVTGEVLAYDLDRENIARSFRLPNFWKERDPNARIVGLVGISLHPRDIGQMLIAYTTGIVIYSFKQNKALKFFEYVLKPGAPGGGGLPPDTVRRPRITHALWHPTGTFIMTAHEDSSLVFWDPKDGRIIMARTLTEMHVDQAAPNAEQVGYTEPYGRIAWCCKENPDDTGLLISGGQSPESPQEGLTFIELGQTPIYATSSWQVLQDHLKGKRQITLPTPPGAQVADFLLIPRSSPYFAGAQDPIAIMTLLTSGELLTMSFPSGYPISPTNQLHPSISFVHPYVNKFAVQTLDRGRWMGMVETRNQGEPLLKGGAETAKPKRRYEGRTIFQIAHGDSTVRLWDAGHNDEIENPTMLQVDVARALDRYEDIDITAMNMAPNTGEFAVGTRTGELVLYRWAGNRFFGKDHHEDLPPNPGALTDISSRAEPGLKEGLQPWQLYEMMQGPITAACVSDVGFVGVGSEGGFFSVIDLRGPSVIFQISMTEFAQQSKRSSFLKGSHGNAHGKEWPVAIEFSVMTLEGDNYSSICCFVGTNLGKVATFKLLPSGNSYSVKLAGVQHFDGKVVALCPIQADSGRPAFATGPIVAGLRNGQQVNGVLIAVTQTEIRIFKPAGGKGASKTFDDIMCDAANVTEFELHGFAIVGVFGDRTTRAFSIPGLKEIGNAPLPMLDGSRTLSSVVTQTGDIFGWTGPSEIAVLNVWGTAKDLQVSDDILVNPELVTPPRPTISNMQWLSGTQHISPTDLDLLIDPNRPPSRRMMAAAAAEARAARSAGQPGSSNAGGSNEGWGDYLTRQLNERTEKLNIMNDSMDSLQNQSQGWADDVGKYINKQKRNVVLGGIKGKFF